MRGPIRGFQVVSTLAWAFVLGLCRRWCIYPHIFSLVHSPMRGFYVRLRPRLGDRFVLRGLCPYLRICPHISKTFGPLTLSLHFTSSVKPWAWVSALAWAFT